MTPEQIGKRYEKRILGILNGIRDALNESGRYRADEPFYMDSDEEDSWWMIVCPHKRAHKLPKEGDVDIAFTIVLSEPSDGSKGGVNFSIVITGHGGSIIGGFTPYNYTPDVWVPRRDAEAIEDRFSLMEEVYGSEIVDTLDEHFEREKRRS